MAATIKELILTLLSDGRWHSNLEIFNACGGKTWSWIQRMSELRRAGIVIDKREISSTHYEYKLVTPPEEIDFQRGRLKPQDAVAPKEAKPEEKFKIKKPEQMEMILN